MVILISYGEIKIRSFTIVGGGNLKNFFGIVAPID